MSQRRSTIGRWLMWACAAIAVTAGAAARGQGTSGTLPDPITTAELMSYADRLGLSDQQRQAISALHDEYKQQFRILREGEISQFLQDMRGAESGGKMPARKDVEDIFKRMTVLNRKIELLMKHFGTQRSKAWFDDEVFRGLARLRGMECVAPERYAEAFVARKLALSIP